MAKYKISQGREAWTGLAYSLRMIDPETRPTINAMTKLHVAPLTNMGINRIIDFLRSALGI